MSELVLVRKDAWYPHGDKRNIAILELKAYGNIIVLDEFKNDSHSPYIYFLREEIPKIIDYLTKYLREAEDVNSN